MRDAFAERFNFPREIAAKDLSPDAGNTALIRRE
jgi:hypothetical protein